MPLYCLNTARQAFYDYHTQISPEISAQVDAAFISAGEKLDSSSGSNTFCLISSTMLANPHQLDSKFITVQNKDLKKTFPYLYDTWKQIHGFKKNFPSAFLATTFNYHRNSRAPEPSKKNKQTKK